MDFLDMTPTPGRFATSAKLKIFLPDEGRPMPEVVALVAPSYAIAMGTVANSGLGADEGVEKLDVGLA